MKSTLLLLSLTLLILFSCRKENGDTAPVTAVQAVQQTLTLAEVQSWYQGQANLQASSNLKSFRLAKLNLNWQKASSAEGKKQNYWLIALPGQPTFQNKKQGYRKIAFLKDSTGNIQSRILEIVPDAIYWQRKGQVSTADFTGYVFFYDQGYHFLGGKYIKAGSKLA